jgi:hypothetical protein
MVTRGGRGRAGELAAACADGAELDQGPESAPPAMPGGMEGAGSPGDAQGEESQEFRAGLAAVYARIEQYGPGRAFIREAEAWLAQCCQRTRQDCLPGHVTAFMEAVFVPGHQDARSASGAPCCAPRTVERALSRLNVWFKGAGRTNRWSMLAESSVQCCNPVLSQEVMVWQMAYEHSVVTGTDIFMPPVAPATAAAGAAAGAAAPFQQGGGAAAAGPGQGGAAGPGLGGAAGQGQGRAAAAGFAQGAAAGRRQRHMAAAALGSAQGAAAAAARPARRAAVRPRQGGAGDAVTDAEYMQSLQEMEAELGGRGRPRAAAVVPPPQQADAGQARPAPQPMRPAQPPPRARRPGQAAAAAGASHARVPGGSGARTAMRAWPPASPGTARRARVPRLHAC